MLLGTLDASLLGNILAGKRAIAKSISEQTKSKSQGWGVNRAGEGAIAKSVSKKTKSKSISEGKKLKRQGRGIVRAGYGNKKVRKTTTKNKMDF